MEGDRGLAKRIPARLTTAELRRFGLLVGGIFVLLGGVTRWRGHPTSSLVFWVLGGLLILGGLVIPAQLGPVYRAWMGLAHLISKVTTPIVMGVMYYLVISPLGLLARLFGHRPLRRPPGPSFWVARPAGDRRSDMTRQF
jgi:hypothetical protein